jgi:hypothetical protein
MNERYIGMRGKKKLSEKIGSGWEREREAREQHLTPWGLVM